MVTDGIENAIPPYRWQQLFDEQRQEPSTYDGQIQIMSHEEGVELVGRPFPHYFPASEYYYIVGYQHGCSLLECRHGRPPWHELEILRGVTPNGGVQLVKDGP